MDEDINRTNKALDELRQIKTVQYDGREFGGEPQLSDFYQPSDEMEYLEWAVII